MLRGFRDSIALSRSGRITLPAFLRKELAEHWDNEAVLNVNPFGDKEIVQRAFFEKGVEQLEAWAQSERCLVAVRPLSWQLMNDWLHSLPDDNKIYRRMKQLVSGHANLSKIDSRSRLTIPKVLREIAELRDKVTIIGLGSIFEIWDEANWALEREAWLNSLAGQLDHSTIWGPLRVVTIPASVEVLRLLRGNPSLLYELGPEDLEVLVCDRFQKMGFLCSRLGRTLKADGGVDIIACPRESTPFPFLLAVQVKSHRDARHKTRVAAVRDFYGAIKSQPFRGGVLVTNTTFTMDAHWFAKRQDYFVQLRDFHHLVRWIRDEFAAREFWREIPAVLELRPGLSISIPKILRTE